MSEVNEIEWVKLPPIENAPEQSCWGTHVADYTIVVSYDKKFPEYGWHASWKRKGDAMATHMDEKFSTKANAQKAALSVVRGRLN